MGEQLPWAPTALPPMTTEREVMGQEIEHEEQHTSSPTPPCGSLHHLPWAWRTGPASTSTCTHKACSVAVSPSPTCCRGTADLSKSPCWSPATGRSGRRPVRCSSWCRPTWGTGLPVWTAVTAPCSLSPSAGTCQGCGTNCMCSWWGRPPATPAPEAWRQDGSWWLSAWRSLPPRLSSAATWRAISRDTRSPPATRNVSLRLSNRVGHLSFFLYLPVLSDRQHYLCRPKTFLTLF